MKIRDQLSKPSEALQAMLDGLEMQDAREDFKIEMDTFGDYVEGVCFGCAATCTIQHVIGTDFGDQRIVEIKDRAEYLDLALRELDDFEFSIDRARIGLMYSLFEFFGLNLDPKYSGRFCLGNSNWREQIPAVQAVIEEMKKDGI